MDNRGIKLISYVLHVSDHGLSIGVVILALDWVLGGAARRKLGRLGHDEVANNQGDRE